MARPSHASEPQSPLARMVQSEAFPGILLVACAAAAILIANSPWAHGWEHLWHVDLAVRLGDHEVGKSAAHWINDGLMVLFFFFVGLEIKHEILDGELQSLRQAALPVAAAIGGMAVPAAVYHATVLAHGTPAAAAGWGIPMATDIAFALGVLAILGNRVPASLKVFLATLAIVDDLGAVLVIAVFYTEQISWLYLGIGALVLVASFAANRLGVRSTWPYVVFGLLIWVTFLQSGVHATIAGVALAFTIPARRQLDEREFSSRGRQLLADFDREMDPSPRTNDAQLGIVHEMQRHAVSVQAPLQRMEHGLHPFIAHFVVPVFALANAGIDVTHGATTAPEHPAAQGVFLGLVVGKPLGVLLASWITVRLLGAELPRGATWRHIHGTAWLAGIGFTMSLFLDSLAFADQPESFAAAKVAILAASFLTGITGYLMLRGAPKAG
ncbi:MAG: Na+/H+ antiporter NhaA [Planctomycetes bacterium]|nr:Na+/H+ antiporter NhaA [Planctomycetota bacterium]